MLKQFADRLRGLFRSSAQSQADEVAKRAARLEQNVLALVGNVPTMPDTATRAMALADDPRTTFADFARLIEGDAAIATGLLRIANSVLYAGGRPAMKLQQAVVRLGMFQCKNLILLIGMKSMLWEMAGSEKQQCEVLWHHGHVTASLCRQINRAYRVGFDGEDFSAGLLHDLGRILLLLADPECFKLAQAMDFREGAETLERERRAIGIDHCALGGWFGEHSKLPETLIEAIRFHHDPTRAAKSKLLVALVATADDMANHLQRGEDVAAYEPAANLGLAHLWARWPETKKELLLNDLPTLLNEAVQLTASVPLA